jgi:hypothetical protein
LFQSSAANSTSDLVRGHQADNCWTKQRTKTSFDLVTAWNGHWFDSLCVPVMNAWRADMDIRFALDFGKVLEHVTKCVTKQESISKAGTQRLQLWMMASQLTTPCRKPWVS